MDGLKVGNLEKAAEPVQAEVGNGDDIRLNLLCEAIKPEPVMFTVDCLFGHVEIVSTSRREGNKEILGGYAIRYDRNGVEVSRTEDTPNLIVTHSEPERSEWLVQRLVRKWLKWVASET